MSRHVLTQILIDRQCCPASSTHSHDTAQTRNQNQSCLAHGSLTLCSRAAAPASTPLKARFEKRFALRCSNPIATAKRPAPSLSSANMHGAKPLVNARQVYARLTSVRRARQEHFVVFCLNTRGCPIRREVVSIGTLNATLVHPREVFYHAIVHNAASIILAHNHPSGDSTPSDEDIA